MSKQLITTKLLDMHNDVKDVYACRFNDEGRQAHKQIEDILRRRRRYEEGMCDDIINEGGRIAEKPTVTMTEIENAVGDTSDEYTEGVVELFESKGFEVIGK